MATKGELLYCKDTKKSFLGVASKDQYGSLNLNLTNHQAVIFKTLHSNSIDNKKFQNYDVLKDSRKVSTSWNNSSKQLTSTVLNLDRDSKEIGEFKKAKNINKSTLSLHIAAYENSITSDDSDGVERESLKAKDEKSGFAKKWETSNHLVNLSIIQNPFEFPRQQDDRAGYPDLMQFRASQRLLNPNQMDENNRRRHLPPSVMRLPTYAQWLDTNNQIQQSSLSHTMHNSNRPVYFNEHVPKQIPHNDVAKNDVTDNHKLKQLARCCICFDNYSLNARAPICVPCGHSFCAVCIRKLIWGNLVCCCICRKVTFFGPTDLGKNIQLLDILESLKLLDPDESKLPVPSSSRSFNVPENVIDGVEDKDLVKFFEFCFNFVKKFYERRQEDLINNIAMSSEEGHNHIAQNAERMFLVRNQLGDSLENALLRFNECLQTMDAISNDHNAQMYELNYGGVDGYLPPIDDDLNDPFGLESVPVHQYIYAEPDPEFMQAVQALEAIRDAPEENYGRSVGEFLDFEDRSRDHHYYDFNEPAEDEDYDDFRPGPWNPLSKLFALPRADRYN